jgi:DNA-directed RNA polymerase subunit RPC12/RpoP
MKEKCLKCGKSHGGIKTVGTLILKRPGRCPKCGHNSMINKYSSKGGIKILGKVCSVCYKK